MRKANSITQQIFQVRFIATAEQRIGVKKDQWGFITEVAKSLGFVRSTVVTRWLHGSVPSGCHLVTIHEKWGVSPSYLLGTE